MRISLKSPTGFIVYGVEGTPVLVADAETGKPFYYNTIKGKGLTFNLPVGVYTLDTKGKVFKTDFHKYELPRLDKATRRIQRPNNFTLKLEKNPNKCTVYLQNGLIVADPEFWASLNRAQKMFILLHEQGHYYYKGGDPKSEYSCDKFAKRIMLKIGYNPSQLAAIAKTTLSPNQFERVFLNYQTAKKSDSISQ